MTDKVLYLECACGISGDMTVAALLDLGASREKLDRALASLELEISATRCRAASHTEWPAAISKL
ncbi:hypothetical protein SDC9_189375 [bioreactor metagenome]|uniref:Pyridinium-3,5-bisthiocarboxylic acid mononucleotide nickel insertion protein n=1 Tax=bioreactor metagenome TaxID=1076179 RepID=A0A645HSJ7_9ZZZZ